PAVDVAVELRNDLAVGEFSATHERAGVELLFAPRLGDDAPPGLARCEVLETDVSAPCRHLVGEARGLCGVDADRLDDGPARKAGLLGQVADDLRLGAVADLVDDPRQDLRKLSMKPDDLLPEALDVSIGPRDLENFRRGH